MPTSPRSRLASRIRIGISGWNYPPWRGEFFPEGLQQRRELEFASRQVNSIEINGTFYSLQKPDSYRKWYAETPDDFIFSVKGGRFITHIKRLKEVATPLANFFASGVLALGKKLGPFLWQLPPNLQYNPAVLESFFKQLPRDADEAASLARKHNSKVTGRSLLTPHDVGPLRHALEVRHPSFENEEFIELLRHHQIALVVADTAGKWPFIEEVTTDFIYVRLHGDVEIYASGYTTRALDQWAAKVRSWSQGKVPRGSRRVVSSRPPVAASREVFVYFDNDIKVRAPFDAISLGKRLGLRPPVALPEEARQKSALRKQ